MPHLAELVASAKAAVEDAQDVAALDLVRVEYFGKKGHFTLQMQSLRDVPAEDRPAVVSALAGLWGVNTNARRIAVSPAQA